MPQPTPETVHHRPPSLDALLRNDALQRLVADFGREATTQAARAVLGRLRSLGSSHWTADAVSATRLAAQCQAHLQAQSAPRLKAVFNLTGTVLHTNLGRALMAEPAIEAMALAAASPVNLEYDLDGGERGDRDDVVEDLLRQLTGAEAATVVNNNAAAVLLALSTLAGMDAEGDKAGGQVIVSRGELVEIGGAFRIPDIMRRAGCQLLEVGTTNRTHARDYAAAIGERCAALLKVHTSNYAIQGFTHSVSEAEVAAIAHARGLPFMVDLGSGTLVDLAALGLGREPTVAESIAAGADLVTFSGDKLLGGPQAGLIVGRAALIERIKRNPLKRALRVGKLTLAALEATLRLYQRPDTLAQTLPTLRLFTRRACDIERQATRVLVPIQAALGSHWLVQTQPMRSQIGSGALPVESLNSAGLVIAPHSPRVKLSALLEGLRQAARPVIARVQQGALWLDMRCLDEGDEAALVEQFRVLAPGVKTGVPADVPTGAAQP